MAVARHRRREQGRLGGGQILDGLKHRTNVPRINDLQPILLGINPREYLVLQSMVKRSTVGWIGIRMRG